MSLKKLKVISLFGIFALSFLCHFAYSWLPNPIFSIIFPVNESIWEHMKIIVTSTLLFSFIEKYLLNKHNIYHNNYLFNLVLISVSGVIIYLLIYLPLYSIFGENMFISITLLFIIYIIMQVMSYYLISYKELNVNKYISLLLIVIIYIIFGYLTYKPIKNYIFYDTKDNKYGINIKE